MQDDALRRVKSRRETVGDGVGDRNELDLERAYPSSLAVAHLDEPGAIDQPRFLDTVSCKTQRESRAEHVGRQVAKQISESSRVVLMTVGEDDCLHMIGALTQ